MKGAGRAPLVLAVLGVLALVAVVAVASTGSTPTGTGDGRPPADTLLDTVFSLALLLYLPALALLVYGLLQRKEIAREIASGRYRRTSVWAYLVLMGALSLAVYFRLTDFRFDLRGEGNEVVDQGAVRPGGAPADAAPGKNEYEPEFAWISVVAVVALAAIAVAAYAVSSRRRTAQAAVHEHAADHVADTLADTLDDLRAEPDPRRAVIAAYARLERALASSGLPRRPAETAEEYVGRILDRLEVDPAPVRELTGMFETAKFSHHAVDEPMRERAIAALVRIRDELRQSARRRREELEREQAAGAPPQAAAS